MKWRPWPAGLTELGRFPVLQCLSGDDSDLVTTL